MNLPEAFTYLQRGLEYLQNRLAVAKTDLQIDFPVYDLGEFRSLEQKDYRLEYGSGNAPDAVSLTCSLSRPENTRIESRYEGCDIALLGQLRSEGLQIVSSRVLGFDSALKAVSLELVSSVPVHFRFDLNEACERIDFWVANYQSLGVRHYMLSPSQISEQFLCGLEACLLREDDAFLDSLTPSERLVTFRQLAENEPWEDGFSSEETQVDNIVSFDRPLPSRNRVIKLRMNGEIFEVHPRMGDFYLGRGLEASLRVEALSVSRSHARLFFQDGEFFLGDISSNGSFIQQDGKPELFIHQGMRKLCGEGVIALGNPVEDAESKLIRYSVE